MTAESACRTLVAEFQSKPTIRAGSLITTVFGDAIAPRGGVVWLGSLIEAMALFEVNERLVRTSVYRLSKDGWLEAEQVGRRAYYQLTSDGRERFRAATHRIYGEPVSRWDGSWCLLLLPMLNAVTRDLVRRECGWLGFGMVSTNLLAHPGPSYEDLEATLKRLGVHEDVVVMTGCLSHDERAMQMIARDAWNLADIDARYQRFIDKFAPVRETVGASERLEPAQAFIIRTMLIQEYRKVLLRDPHLPADLLPAGWHGNEAYALCRDLYRRVYAPADAFLDTLETQHGYLPPAGPETAARFGGLVSKEATA